MARIVATVLTAAALVALTGCRTATPKGPDTTVPTAAPASVTTATTAVSYAVPATIDVAYVQKVMGALDHIEGEIARHVAATHALDGDFGRYMVALYGGESLQLQQQLWESVASKAFQQLRPQPRDPKTTIVRLIAASPGCLLVRADRDYINTFVPSGPPGPPRYVGLVPITQDRNLDGRNPTPWIVTFDGSFSDSHEPTTEEACSKP
jgi:hypothetical protein